MPHDTTQACNICYGLTKKLEQREHPNPIMQQYTIELYQARILDSQNKALEALALLEKTELYTPEQIEEAKEACATCNKKEPSLSRILNDIQFSE